MTSQQARALARSKLSDERFYHTECVARSAATLAGKLGVDTETARAAAFLHDVLKEEPAEDLLQILMASDIINFDDLSASSPVWHAFAGGEYLEHELGLPKETADAVRYHTTARADMSPLDKTVYLADYISVDRDFRGAAEVRLLAETDIDSAILLSLKNQIIHLTKLGKHVCMHTIEAYNFLVDAGVTAE